MTGVQTCALPILKISPITDNTRTFRANRRNITNREGKLLYRTTTYFLREDLNWERFANFLKNKYQSASKAYPKRTIEGEEIGSLIGCFRQGKLENIVVFSDAYFKKAQGMWKYTNILTGDKIEEKALRIDGVTIKQEIGRAHV